RKGYGTEAATLLLDSCFSHYWAHVVGCSVPDFDEGGLAFAEKLGFKRQGVQRRAGFVDGKFFDSVFLDILRNEFLTARSQGDDA
ncbi:MAG: GNAT family N-acetyltransferase, partial [Thermoplasmata archaeon]